MEGGRLRTALPKCTSQSVPNRRLVSCFGVFRFVLLPPEDFLLCFTTFQDIWLKLLKAENASGLVPSAVCLFVYPKLVRARLCFCFFSSDLRVNCVPRFISSLGSDNFSGVTMEVSALAS